VTTLVQSNLLFITLYSKNVIVAIAHMSVNKFE